MNCELVRERLSAYLDNMLASDEYGEIMLHLQRCSRCMMLLAELRQNDILLAWLPRMSPHPALSERIFASPEMLELTDLLDSQYDFMTFEQWRSPLALQQLGNQETAPRPRLISLPGGRSSLPDTTALPVTQPITAAHLIPGRRMRRLRRPLFLLKISRWLADLFTETDGQ